MRLAGHVRHVGFYHEMVVHAGVLYVVRQYQGNVRQERTVVTGRCLAFVHHLFLQSVSEIAALPIPRIAHPPVCHTALHRILHLRILDGYAGIAQRLALCTDGVAGLVGLLVFGELHLERRTLVFLYIEGCRLVVGTYGEPSVQQTLRQCKLSGTFAEAVGGQLLLGHHLVVGVAQLEVHALALDGNVVQCRLLLPHDGRHMHRLSRTVDAAVGEYVGMLCDILACIVGVAPVAVHRGIVDVSLGECKQLRRRAVVKLAEHLALLVAGQLFRLRRLFPS